MKRVIGIDFTDYTVRLLREKGFSLQELTEDERHGFRRFCCVLSQSQSDFDGFEIHIVDDEEAYLKFTRLEHFFPYVKDASGPATCSENANSVDGFIEVVDLAKLDNRELREALELRKQFKVSALRLHCQELPRFVAAAQPQRLFSVAGREVAYLHLGPSCFDLLVSAD